jgi:hypothetical protein
MASDDKKPAPPDDAADQAEFRKLARNLVTLDDEPVTQQQQQPQPKKD